LRIKFDVRFANQIFTGFVPRQSVASLGEKSTCGRWLIT
jgi:hypothetical protein